MVASCLCQRCRGCIPSWKIALLTVAIKEQSSVMGSRTFCLASKLKLSNARITTKVLWCFQVGGSSNERSPGSTAVEGWPSIGKT